MELDVIYNMDTIEGMKTIPDESIDLIVTDPPYLMRYRTKKRSDKNHKFCSEIAGDNDADLISNYIRECYRIMKPDTACYMFCNSNKIDVFKIELENAGFKIKNLIVWVKNNHTAGDLVAQYGKKYEFLFYVNKGRCPIRGKRGVDVWEFKKVANSDLIHQNQKPLDLIEQCILKSSDGGGIVFDGFMGSGTTAIAALETGRRYIGYELDPYYYKVARSRILDYELDRI